MILYLIRHGESVYNAEGRIQGQTDIPLSEMGLRQSQAIAAAFDRIQLDAVFCSPLQRAAQTAAPLAERQQRPIEFMDDLKEIHAGIFAGLLWGEIEQKYPEHARPWREQHPDFVIPGGESRRQLMDRGVRALQTIREHNLEHVAVVAHGGILCAGLKGLLEIPAERNPFNLFNASISRLVWKSRIQLWTLNEIEHLRATDLAKEDAYGNL
jgi:2,3-bisphosphoglycerate-dependent phosphoglycerate mutase